ncbi:MAG TPA: glutamate--tRNA ligase [Nitrososphaerales archaeon]|nr:glutamate--tRNA ligase [Nitrososphaerales archaeon]
MVRGQAGLSEEAIASIERHALVNAVHHEGKADMGAVMGRVLGEHPELRSDPALVEKAVRAELVRVNAMSLSDQTRLLADIDPSALASRPKTVEVRRLPALVGATKGKACFRLPPEPSGFMTIGHAMASTVNFLYKEMYDGVLWLRFEDTNPRKVARKYYESFRRGMGWLGISYDHEKNVSDDMEVIYGYGRRMLVEGTAYACSCALDKMKRMRLSGAECEHRDAPSDRSLRIWDELLAKKHHEGDYVIRFRGDMKSADYSLRDPNIFRVIEHSHPMTGDKYSLWPTFFLANSIEDHLCGVTHVLRSSEFHSDLQRLIRDALKLGHLEVVQFSRYNFKGTTVSKRRLRPLIEDGLVRGWDDPRLPTVEGVRRRGILPQAIRQFTQQVGYTKAEHEYDWSMLFSLNRKLLDPVSRRVFFVPDPVRLTVEGAPKKEVTIPFHPERDLGNRTIATDGDFYVPSADVAAMMKGTTFRLMDLFNVKLASGGVNPEGKYAGEELLPEAKKMQWVTTSHQEITVLVPDLLYNEDGEFNRDSLKEIRGHGEESIASLRIGDIVQFPRFGFCRLDSPGSFIMAHK